jgi:26S proteasome regulatory subunit T6
VLSNNAPPPTHAQQEDFEMSVAKVMKKDSDRNMSLKKLWK